MLKIINGRIFDPEQELEGEVRDIWIQGDKIISPPQKEPEELEVLDAGGLMVMAGAIDIHTHVAGPLVNRARMLWPGQLPSASEVGHLYTLMGYTTIMEAAVFPFLAKQVHEEFNYIPFLNRGAYILVGEGRLFHEFLEEKKLKDYMAWTLSAAGGYGLKLVNPGKPPEFSFSLSQKAREIIQCLLEVNSQLGLPHSLHLHCNNMSQPGNMRITEETVKVANGCPLHLAHGQFHCYEGESWGDVSSGAQAMANLLARNPHLTMDVGQVSFGPALTMSADASLQGRLRKKRRSKWARLGVEGEMEAGLIPIKYAPRNRINTMQWAIGLELFLLAENPGQLFLTTDHPNAGFFTAYPEIIKLLMSREYRREVFSRVNKKGLASTSLEYLDREYSPGEVAMITRSGPARALGLESKGHLKVGADADLSLYGCRQGRLDFSRAVHVIKGGEVVVRDGELARELPGTTLLVHPDYDVVGLEKSLKDMASYQVEDHYLQQKEVVECR